MAPELEFTKLILQILYWISEIVIHSRIFMLDLTSSIDVWNLYYYILAGHWIVYSLFYCLENVVMPQNCRLMMDYEYQGEK
jgi:hypothetical protein